MRIRKKPLGDKNLVGARIESIRRNRGMKQKELLAQLQVRGVDINASALSKLEGQLRTVTDIELLAFAEILDVDVFWPHQQIPTGLKPKPGSTPHGSLPGFLFYRLFISIPCTAKCFYKNSRRAHSFPGISLCNRNACLKAARVRLLLALLALMHSHMVYSGAAMHSEE